MQLFSPFPSFVSSTPTASHLRAKGLWQAQEAFLKRVLSADTLKIKDLPQTERNAVEMARKAFGRGQEGKASLSDRDRGDLMNLLSVSVNNANRLGGRIPSLEVELKALNTPLKN